MSLLLSPTLCPSVSIQPNAAEPLTATYNYKVSYEYPSENQVLVLDPPLRIKTKQIPRPCRVLILPDRLNPAAIKETSWKICPYAGLLQTGGFGTNVCSLRSGIRKSSHSTTPVHTIPLHQREIAAVERRDHGGIQLRICTQSDERADFRGSARDPRTVFSSWLSVLKINTEQANYSSTTVPVALLGNPDILCENR